MSAPQSAENVAPCGPCRRGQHGCCDRGPFLPCGCQVCAENDAPQFDPDGILTCEAVALTWGRCTLLRGHGGWHRAAFDGGRRWPSTQRLYTEQEVWRVTAEHYFVVNPTAYGQESCACGWYRDGWDAPSFEVHLASRLGLLTTPTEEARHG